MRKRLDLIGQRFGRLTVLRPAENIGNCTTWVCRCECGQETVVKTEKLRCGKTKSCGCLRNPNNPLGLTFVDGTCVEFLVSKAMHKNNTSGVPGVNWLACRQSWRAVIDFKGKRYYLGCYRKLEDAIKARKRGEEEFFETFLQEYDSIQAQGTTENNLGTLNQSNTKP